MKKIFGARSGAAGIQGARSGQTLVEYSLLLIVTSVIAITVLVPYANTVKTLFKNSIMSINQFSNYNTQQLNNGIYSSGLSGQDPTTAQSLNVNNSNGTLR